MNENEKNIPETVSETTPEAVSDITPEKEPEAAAEPKTKTKKESKKNNFQKAKKKIPVFRIILIVILVLVLLYLFIPGFKAAVNGVLRKIPFIKNMIPDNVNMQQGEGTYAYYTVTELDIMRSLEGTGTLEAIDTYDVTATVTGDIISADFEEMDEVLEDNVLFVIDSSDLEDDIEDMREDVAEALQDLNDLDKDYEDLNIYSDYNGKVREVYVEKGDMVTQGMPVVYIVDNDTMLLDIPFFAANTDHILQGASATVTFASTGEVLSGSVKEISNLTSVNENNSTIRNITVAVKNPGGITFGMKAYATVAGSDGVYYDCAGAGAFEYNVEETVTAEASGEIEEVYVDDGDYVTDGKLVAKISSENLDNQREQLQKVYDNQVKALEDLEERLEDYTITAPISGTVVQKNYKALDTIGSSSMSSTTSLAVIYDMSKLTFDLMIDELDLSKVQVGQRVIITSDSIENMSFDGVITKKSIVGTSTNGTTVYPVTIEIEGNEYLLPGMNVNAKIVLSSTGSVLAVPVSAVSRGNTVEITKVSVDKSTGNFAQKPETETVKVEIGDTDGNYVEIKSGLSAGDVVVYSVENVQVRNFDMMSMMNGMQQGGAGPDGGGRPNVGGRPSGGSFGGR